MAFVREDSTGCTQICLYPRSERRNGYGAWGCINDQSMNKSHQAVFSLRLKGYTAIQRIDSRKHNEKTFVHQKIINSPQTEHCIHQYSSRILARINQMWKYVSCVNISSNTLQETPYGGQCRKEPENPRMTRIALR